jgi:hypothetical protein
VAKLALTDEWTNFFVDAAYEGARWTTHATALSSGDADGDDADVPGDSTDEPLSLFAPRRVHVFYAVRVSLLLLKLYLDSRMLGLFVRSMHASSSLMASTYNQCATIILAVSWEHSASTADARKAIREVHDIAVPRADRHFLLLLFSLRCSCSFPVAGHVRCKFVLRIPFVELAPRRRTHSHWCMLCAMGTQRR